MSTTIVLDLPLLSITASPSGGEYVHAQLIEVLSTMSAPPLTASCRARGRQAFADDGSLVDERMHQQLAAGMAALMTAMAARSRG